MASSDRHPAVTRRRMAVTVAAVIVASVLVPGTSTSSAEPDACVPADPPTCTLRQLADRVPLRMGATLEPAQIADADYATTLSREFNALTAENAMKWYSIQNTRGVFTFDGADAVLAFAEANGMEVRGHALVWAQDQFTPAWVRGITDPDEMRQVVFEHIDTVLDRYRGRIHRWDVVNEPLAYGTGGGQSDNVYRRVLGPTWLADIYRHAHETDPTLELWLNEYGTDWIPGKHEELLALVRDLLGQGVPLHGIGLQTHRITPDGPDRKVFEARLQDFADLGLKVAITELDVATRPDDPTGQERQAEAYRTIVAACLAVPACEEVTTWGVTDGDTWLDTQGIFPPPTRPLLFDEAFAPKASYRAVAEELALGRPVVEEPPTTTTTSATTTTEPDDGSSPTAPGAVPVEGTPTFTG